MGETGDLKGIVEAGNVREILPVPGNDCCRSDAVELTDLDLQFNRCLVFSGTM